MRETSRGGFLDSRFEDRLEEIDLLEIKDLDSLIPFFQDAMKFLNQYRIVQAKGDLAEKNRLQRTIFILKELLLDSMDRIEQRLKLDPDQLESYLDRFEDFKVDEQEFLDLIRAERKKTFHKTQAQALDLVAKVKKGKTKVKNWMRP